MNQEARSERSRAHILDAALRLFSTVGYHGTSMRDIAREAGVSTGNVYHQFPDKESLFRTLLDQYWTAVASPEFPFNKALASGAFPSDLEALARAARDSVVQYRRYVSLIYVDVVEFDGSHIRKFYSDMASRFDAFLTEHRRADPARPVARRRPPAGGHHGGQPLLSAVLRGRDPLRRAGPFRSRHRRLRSRRSWRSSSSGC